MVTAGAADAALCKPSSAFLPLGRTLQTPNKRLSSVDLLGCRCPDFRDQLVEVSVPFLDQFQPSHLVPNGFLKELRRRKPARFHECVEFVWYLARVLQAVERCRFGPPVFCYG